MAEIKKISMKDQVYDVIRKRILTGEYSLGEAINIVHIAKEFGISNTPIREALTRLETEGLLETSINTKFRVIEISEKTLFDLNSTGSILLNGGYNLCIELNKSHLLKDMLEKALIYQGKIAETANTYEYINAAISFDRCFLEATGNKILLESFNVLSARLFLATLYNDINAREENIKQHKDILHAVKKDDVTLAKQLIKKHFDKHLPI